MSEAEQERRPARIIFTESGSVMRYPAWTPPPDSRIKEMVAANLKICSHCGVDFRKRERTAICSGCGRKIHPDCRDCY